MIKKQKIHLILGIVFGFKEYVKIKKPEQKKNIIVTDNIEVAKKTHDMKATKRISNIELVENTHVFDISKEANLTELVTPVKWELSSDCDDD